MKKVLTLDVAYAHLGWAVIEPYLGQDIIVAVGCIKNPSDPKKKKQNLRASSVTIERIAYLYRELRAVYQEHKPGCLIAEIPGGGGKSSKSVAGMAMGTSVVAALVTQFEIPSEWTTQDAGKIALCRCKGASKFEMQAAAMKKFPELTTMVKKNKQSKTGYDATFEHGADAIAAFLAARHGALIRYLADANGPLITDALF